MSLSSFILILHFIWQQVNESDADDQDFAEYALDFMAGKKLNINYIIIIC